MSFLSFLTGGRMHPALGVSDIVSPFAPASHFVAAMVTDWVGEQKDDGTTTVTEELALRVPEVNRALQAHQALVAPLKYNRHAQDGSEAEQPGWVAGSASGISPFIRWNGVVRDLFLHGWACLGGRKEDGDLPDDFIHVPRSMWSVDTSTGAVTIDESVPAAYRTPYLIPLGSAGLLTDGVDSVRQARKLELARQRRIDAPPAATELHIKEAARDEMTDDEKATLAKGYAENRRKYAVAVTPSYLEVKDHANDSVDLFESGMNSLRLQLAMHCGVPASFLEAGKEGGSAGEMTYTNENGKASELWVFGSARFAYAILGRLSMDDIAGEGHEIRADLSEFLMTPSTELSAETTPKEVTA